MTEINKLIDLEKDFIASFENLINAEMNHGCVDGKIIGTGQSDYTQGSTFYDLKIDKKTFSLIDIPGIEGDESRFEEIIRTSLDKSHTIFYVNGSGKKIEKATLEKIKNYMHDGTSVYAVFNIHCKPKKNRIPGIDKTYSDELAEAYAQSREVINQTERELRSFLGDNYKGSMPVNGLLSFCGLAVNADGSTSIVFDKDKSLRSDQKKYLNEYGGDRTAMLKDSNISEIQEIISEKAMGFEDYIYDENIKKLKNRLSEMIDRISELKKSESAKIGRFMGICNEFDSNCYNAKEDYIQSLRHIGHNAASDAFSGVKEDLFGMIERDGGKTKPKEIQRYFDEHKNQIINDIQNFINKKLNELQNDYDERIKDSVQRMAKDFDKEQTVFQVSLSSVNISIDESFADAFKYDMKTFGGDVFRVGSLALSGAGIGTLFAPGIGTAIGAVIGAIAGVLAGIAKFFISEQKRINKAKSELQVSIDEQIDQVDYEIGKQIRNLNFEEKINGSYEQIRRQTDKQKRMLENVKDIMNRVESELKNNYRVIS